MRSSGNNTIRVMYLYRHQMNRYIPPELTTLISEYSIVPQLYVAKSWSMVQVDKAISYLLDKYATISEVVASGSNDEVQFIMEHLNNGKIQYHHDDVIDIAIASLRRGYMNIYHWAVDKGLYADIDDDILEGDIASAAAYGGHLKILKDMINLGAENYIDIALSAISGRETNILLWMIKHYHVNDVVYEVSNLNLDDIKYLFSHNVFLSIDPTRLAMCACMAMKDKVLQYIASLYPEKEYMSMYSTYIQYRDKVYEPYAIVKYLFDHNRLDLLKYIPSEDLFVIGDDAGTNGRSDILTWVVETSPSNQRANVITNAIGSAYENGHLSMFKTIPHLDGNNIRHIAEIAAVNDDLDMVKWAIGRGADNYTEIVSSTFMHKPDVAIDIVRYINTITDIDWDAVSYTLSINVVYEDLSTKVQVVRSILGTSK